MLLHVEDKIAALTAIPAKNGEVRLPCPAAGLLLLCECGLRKELHTICCLAEPTQVIAAFQCFEISTWAAL